MFSKIAYSERVDASMRYCKNHADLAFYKVAHHQETCFLCPKCVNDMRVKDKIHRAKANHRNDPLACVCEKTFLRVLHLPTGLDVTEMLPRQVR